MNPWAGPARQVFGHRVVRRTKALRTRVAEGVGWSRWSRPGLDGLDGRLVAHLGEQRDGRFIEFGANDGLQQSNTYRLERELGWRGVLIEPVPVLASECLRNRPLATVICAAVSDPAVAGRPVGLAEDDLMTTIGDSRLMAGVVTLDAVIDSVLGGVAPDLVVVDVEGHELAALAGLDLTRHHPSWLLVETADVDAVSAQLGSRYGDPIALSHHDHLYRAAGR